MDADGLREMRCKVNCPSAWRPQATPLLICVHPRPSAVKPLFRAVCICVPFIRLAENPPNFRLVKILVMHPHASAARCGVRSVVRPTGEIRILAGCVSEVADQTQPVSGKKPIF